MMRQRCRNFFWRQPVMRRGQAGFTLIEVLVSATVMALGILSISLTQPMLNASSDAARLRAEASRLAQQKLDEFRAYQQAAASLDASVLTFDGSLVDGSDQVGSATLIANTAFSRTWAVCARNTQASSCLADNSPTALFKLVTVNVSWTDRGGVPDSVSLSSVIARSDPADLGTLAVGPGRVSVRQPRNRNVDIPYEATTLPDGIHSAFQPFGATSPYFLFDNKSGLVKRVCVGNASISGNTIEGDSCQAFATAAYGLSGYVRFCPESGSCDPANPTSEAKRALAAVPLSFDPSNRSGEAPAYSACYSGRQVVLNDGTLKLDAEEADNLITARLIAYFCVVQPTAVAGPWSGRVTLNADNTTGWFISPTEGTVEQRYKVCRYTADYERTASGHADCQALSAEKKLLNNLNDKAENACRMTNNEHPLWYRGVNASLLNQNFLVVKAASACPVMGAATPLDNPAIYVNASTAVHQTSGNTTVGAQLSFTCIAQDCSDKLNIEPGTTSTLLLTE